MDTSLYPYIQTKLPCDKTKPIQINIPKTQICTVNQIKVKVETEETQRESMEPALTMISKPNTHLVNDRVLQTLAQEILENASKDRKVILLANQHTKSWQQLIDLIHMLFFLYRQKERSAEYTSKELKNLRELEEQTFNTANAFKGFMSKLAPGRAGSEAILQWEQNCPYELILTVEAPRTDKIRLPVIVAVEWKFNNLYIDDVANVRVTNMASLHTLIFGSTDTEKEYLGLSGVPYFGFVPPAPDTKYEAQRIHRDLLLTQRNSLLALSFNANQIQSIFALLAAILHLGNINFKPTDTITLKDEQSSDAAYMAAQLMQVSEQAFLDFIFASETYEDAYDAVRVLAIKIHANILQALALQANRATRDLSTRNDLIKNKIRISDFQFCPQRKSPAGLGVLIQNTLAEAALAQCQEWTVQADILVYEEAGCIPPACKDLSSVEMAVILETLLETIETANDGLELQSMVNSLSREYISITFDKVKQDLVILINHTYGFTQEYSVDLLLQENATHLHLIPDVNELFSKSESVVLTDKKFAELPASRIRKALQFLSSGRLHKEPYIFVHTSKQSIPNILQSWINWYAEYHDYQADFGSFLIEFAEMLPESFPIPGALTKNGTMKPNWRESKAIDLQPIALEILISAKLEPGCFQVGTERVFLRSSAYERLKKILNGEMRPSEEPPQPTMRPTTKARESSRSVDQTQELSTHRHSTARASIMKEFVPKPGHLSMSTVEQLAVAGRQFVCKGSVWEVIHAKSVKERVLFLFNDLLMVTKADEFANNSASSDAAQHEIKTIMSLAEVQLDKRDKVRHAELYTGSTSFTTAFSINPFVAIEDVIRRNYIKDTPSRIASFLWQNQNLDSKAVGEYLAQPGNEATYSAWLGFFQFSQINFDDCLRWTFNKVTLLASKYGIESVERMITSFAKEWYGQVIDGKKPSTYPGKDRKRKSGIVPNDEVATVREASRKAEFVVALEEARLRGEITDSSKQSFIQSWIRTRDSQEVVDVGWYHQMYNSILQTGITDPRLSHTTKFRKVKISSVPYRLCVKTVTDTFRIELDAIDPSIRIKIHGTGFRVLPNSVLHFDRSRSQEFQLECFQIGKTQMHFAVLGEGSGNYERPGCYGLHIDPGFMSHVFRLAVSKTSAREPGAVESAADSQERERSYMFSVANADQKVTWTTRLDEVIKSAQGATTKEIEGIAIENIPLIESFKLTGGAVKLFPSWSQLPLNSSIY